MASGKRTDIFGLLQATNNIGIAAGKTWKLVLDGGIRWNATYAMIRRALELKQALKEYIIKLKVSKDALDLEVGAEDYLTDEEWESLAIIRDQLEPLFRMTKSLEGNADLQDGACKASHGALWEILPGFDSILAHFEQLETRAKNGEFNEHPGIQSSITEAWNTAKEYYGKTDASIAWMAALVLHPRFKWKYFDDNWKGISGLARTINPSKTKLKKLWTEKYKRTPASERMSQTPEPTIELEPIDFFEDLLSKVAPTGEEEEEIEEPTAQHDQLWCYLNEPPTKKPLMEYWKSREAKWPQLTQMAYDFLAVPAMSSECERVFSSVAKQTTPESASLSGELLWHQECLSNWQRRGAIQLERAFHAVLLDFN